MFNINQLLLIIIVVATGDRHDKSETVKIRRCLNERKISKNK